MFENVFWDKAKGSYVWIEGKKYIDFTSSIFSQNFGHNNPYVIKEVKKQLKKCSHAYGYNTDVRNEFIYELKELTGYNTILLFTTGAEAIEAAMKIVIASRKIPVGFLGAMHGRTLCCEALVGKRRGSFPVDYFIKIENNDIISSREHRGFFVEGYRGYDCRKLSENDIKKLKEAQQNNDLLIMDEIQSGFFRTRRFFAYQSYGLFPDIVVIGKSIGGGFPISAVCFNSDNTNISGIETLELTSTHAGQPIQMAAGLGIIKWIKDKYDYQKYNKNISIIDHYFPDKFFGMVGAFEVDDEEVFYKNCFNMGLLVVPTGKGYIKIAPPINIDEKTLIKGLEILKWVLKMEEVVRGGK